LAANSTQQRDALVNKLLSNLTVQELAHQVHLVFADNVIGPMSHNELYDSYVGKSGIGVIHDWFDPFDPFLSELLTCST
jgi:hypothetical protein